MSQACILQENKNLKSSLNSYEQTQFVDQSKQLSSKIKIVGNIEIITSMVTVNNPQDIKNIADLLRDHIKSGIINLGAIIDNKPHTLLVITDDLVEKGAVAVIYYTDDNYAESPKEKFKKIISSGIPVLFCFKLSQNLINRKISFSVSLEDSLTKGRNLIAEIKIQF